MFAYCTSIFEVQGCNLKYYLKRGLNVYCIVLKRQADLYNQNSLIVSGSVTSLQSKIQTKKSLPTQNANPADSTTFWLDVFWGGVLGFRPNFCQICSQHDFPKTAYLFCSILRKISKSPKQISEISEKNRSFVSRNRLILGFSSWKFAVGASGFCHPRIHSWSCVFCRKLQR